mgnify:CR=1 FL=1
MNLRNLILTIVCISYSAFSFSTPLPDVPHVYVEGSAAIPVVPDAMILTIEIEKTTRDLAASKNDVELRTRRFLSICKTLGVPSDNISSSPLSIGKGWIREGGERQYDGVSVSREIQLDLKQLELYSPIMKALVEAGVSSVVDTQLAVSNEEELTEKAMMAALADAKRRAERIASSLGMSLGQPFSVSEFKVRRDDRFGLVVSRKVMGNLAEMDDMEMSLNVLSPDFAEEALGPGKMVAFAQVFVVY